MSHRFFIKEVFSTSFFLFFLITNASLKGQQSPLTKKWERLLHFKNGQSEIDSHSLFFLSKNGFKNSKNELDTFIKAVSSDSVSIDDQHPICRFPARYLYLIKNLNIGSITKIKKCKKLNNFIKKIGRGKVSVVFSSYFMSNPSSAFGHTLLKISKKKYLTEEDEDPLLSYGINYAATVDTQNSLLYALKGLFGFFKGQFAAIPYYYKVREYNDYESRDLWTYDLKLTASEIDELILHLWELGDQFSYYYFLNKNCSYFILKILEAIKPNLQLTENFNWFTIPSETIKALKKAPNLVGKVHFRPSTKTRLDKKLSYLSKTDQSEVYSLTKKLSLESHQNKFDFSKKNVLFLEASIEMYDFLNSKEFAKNENKFLEKKMPLLLARSTVQDQNLKKPIWNLIPPDKMHAISYLGLGYFYYDQNNLSAYSLSLRTSFHDLIEPTEGVMPYGEIRLGELDISLTNNGLFRLEKALWVRVSNVMPANTYKFPLSWRMEIASHRSLSTQSLFHEASFFAGSSFHLGLESSHVSFFSFGKMIYDHSPEELLYQVGVETNFRVRILQSLYFQTYAQLFTPQNFRYWDDHLSHRYGLRAQWTKSDWGLRVNYENEEKDSRSTIKLLKYF